MGKGKEKEKVDTGRKVTYALYGPLGLTVLCDDGTIWAKTTKGWEEIRGPEHLQPIKNARLVRDALDALLGEDLQERLTLALAAAGYDEDGILTLLSDLEPAFDGGGDVVGLRDEIKAVLREGGIRI